MIQLVKQSSQSLNSVIHIYSFNSIQHCLQCLAHELNLAIVNIMAEITWIDHIAITTAIWEFNPMLLSNCVMNNSLDVVAAICTLAIKIQASGQWIAYFEWLQRECSISPLLAIPLQNNTCWGQWTECWDAPINYARYDYICHGIHQN